MPGGDRTLRRFSNADSRRSRTLTKTLVLALALGLTGCTVGEQPDGRPGPEAPPPPVGADVPVQPPAPPEPEPVRADVGVTVGVVLPRSGPAYLEQYGDLLLEGIRLAAAGYRDGVVDLVVLDDGGLALSDSALVAEAERRGAIAIIGPMLSAGMAPAAGAREDDAPLILSPTASELPDGALNTYTLNGVDLRGPRALAEYALRGGLTTAAVLYPTGTAFSRQAWTFRQAFEEQGGFVATMMPYDSGTTTFGEHIGRMVETRPAVVYLPFSPDDVQLIAPQIAYYGFSPDSVVVMGNESWTDEEVLRQVAHRFTDGVLVSTPSPRGLGETGWEEFVALYEETYRRSLDNPFPALGWDAMRLVLGAVDAGANTPARVSERFAQTRAFRGATGIVSVEEGMITRAPFLFRLQGGALTAPPPPDLLRPSQPDSAAAGVHDGASRPTPPPTD